MLRDEQEIQKELSEGVAHISASDRESIQSYMRECLGIIKNDLTVWDVSVDYTLTWGSNVENILEAFINETDPDRINEILIKLVNNYRDIYADSESELALHHMAEIAERLISGDSRGERAGKYFGISAGIGITAVAASMAMALLLFAVFIMIKASAIGKSAKEVIKEIREYEEWLQRYSGPLASLAIITYDFLKKVVKKAWRSLNGDGKFPISKDEKWRIIIDLDGDGIDDREEK
jgi:hypothetical protein